MTKDEKDNLVQEATQLVELYEDEFKAYPMPSGEQAWPGLARLVADLKALQVLYQALPVE